jgi:hypothetical protein
MKLSFLPLFLSTCFLYIATKTTILKFLNEEYNYPYNSEAVLELYYQNDKVYMSYANTPIYLQLNEISDFLLGCDKEEDGILETYYVDVSFANKPCTGKYKNTAYSFIVGEGRVILCCQQTQEVNIEIINKDKANHKINSLFKDINNDKEHKKYPVSAALFSDKPFKTKDTIIKVDVWLAEKKAFCGNGYVKVPYVKGENEHTSLEATIIGALKEYKLKPCFKLHGRLLGLSSTECNKFGGISFNSDYSGVLECFVNDLPFKIIKECGGYTSAHVLTYTLYPSPLPVDNNTFKYKSDDYHCKRKYIFSLINLDSDFGLKMLNEIFGFAVVEKNNYFRVSYIPANLEATKITDEEGNSHYFIKRLEKCGKHGNKTLMYQKNCFESVITIHFRNRDIDKKLQLTLEQIQKLCNLFGTGMVQKNLKKKVVCRMSIISEDYMKNEKGVIDYRDLEVYLDANKNDQKALNKQGGKSFIEDKKNFPFKQIVSGLETMQYNFVNK